MFKKWYRLFTDAIALTSREGQETVRMTFLHVFRQEVIRIEFFSIFAPNIRSSMQSVEIDQHCYAGRYLIVSLNWQQRPGRYKKTTTKNWKWKLPILTGACVSRPITATIKEKVKKLLHNLTPITADLAPLGTIEAILWWLVQADRVWWCCRTRFQRRPSRKLPSVLRRLFLGFLGWWPEA